jgi:hypothetical protein
MFTNGGYGDWLTELGTVGDGSGLPDVEYTDLTWSTSQTGSGTESCFGYVKTGHMINVWGTICISAAGDWNQGAFSYDNNDVEAIAINLNCAHDFPYISDFPGPIMVNVSSFGGGQNNTGSGFLQAYFRGPGNGSDPTEFKGPGAYANADIVGFKGIIRPGENQIILLADIQNEDDLDINNTDHNDVRTVGLSPCMFADGPKHTFLFNFQMPTKFHSYARHGYGYSSSNNSTETNVLLDTITTNPTTLTFDAASLQSYTMDVIADSAWTITGQSIPSLLTINPTTGGAGTTSIGVMSATYTAPSTASFNVNLDNGQDTATVAVNFNITGEGGCFLAGTQIDMADGTTKSIEDIKIDDMVLSYDENTNSMTTGRVYETLFHPQDNIYYIVNNNLKVTPNHPFLSKGKWVRIEDLEVGDTLTSESLEEVVITSMDIIYEVKDVYNFEVEDYHSYLVDGLIVHNSPAKSDIRLKENIERIGESTTGIPIYEFDYTNRDGRWQGTMAQDLLELNREDAVLTFNNGMYAVNYDLIDVEFKRIK